MLADNMIHHCTAVDIRGGGGIETYVASLINSRIPGVSERVISSLRNIEQSKFKLLHVHERELLWELRGECPAIYTLHNHSAYCPSGTKYLAASGKCCDRIMSYMDCTWGHLVDSCGSRRPQNIIQNLQGAHRELETLKKLKIPVIANSDYVREQLIKNGLPPDRIVTLHFGIQLPQAATEPLTFEIHQHQKILFAGRIVPDKGLDWLLKALAQTNQQIHLDIAGEGWARPRMEELAKKLGLQNRITWHGWCDKNKLNELYQQCFAVTFPSLWPEPAGLVTLEAYSHYRPIIASAVGGIPEHVRDGETGILVPSNNVTTLAEAITELSSNYQRSRSMGERGHAWLLEEFTLDIHVKRLQQLYEKAIADFQVKPPYKNENLDDCQIQTNLSI